MKEKKCVTLMGRFLLMSLILASIVLSPYGVGKAGAINQDGNASSKAGHIEVAKEEKAPKLQNEPGILKASVNTVCGDVNNDGDVNSIDFAYMRASLLGKRTDLITEKNLSAADVNGDGNFNSLDLAIMRGYLLGKVKGFPIGNNTPSPKPSTTVPVPTPTSNPKNDDFTDDISQASYPVPVGKEVHGKINYEGDQDYMIFIPPSDGLYRVEIYTNVEMSIGYLYVETVEGLKYYYNSFGTYTSKEKGYCYIQEYLTGGTKYILGVKNRKDKVSLDSYTIKISKLN